jgi:hypothetical protein
LSHLPQAFDLAAHQSPVDDEQRAEPHHGDGAKTYKQAV